MSHFLSSESNIVINKPGEATVRRTKQECLLFLRLWRLRGIHIASFTLDFNSDITWPKLTVLHGQKEPCEVM